MKWGWVSRSGGRTVKDGFDAGRAGKPGLFLQRVIRDWLTAAGLTGNRRKENRKVQRALHWEAGFPSPAPRQARFVVFPGAGKTTRTHR